MNKFESAIKKIYFRILKTYLSMVPGVLASNFLSQFLFLLIQADPDSFFVVVLAAEINYFHYFLKANFWLTCIQFEPYPANRVILSVAASSLELGLLNLNKIES